MKDYRLSEIRDECKRKRAEKRDCGYTGKCEFTRACHPYLEMDDVPYPFEWDDIELRDMIELPCKTAINEETWQISPYKWQVVWRGSYKICTYECRTEAEADAFLAELKGDKK